MVSCMYYDFLHVYIYFNIKIYIFVNILIRLLYLNIKDDSIQSIVCFGIIINHYYVSSICGM